MAHTRRTLQLDDKNWDLTLDGMGRIAVQSEGGRATAQNVACEARLFTQDAYFAQDKGIPHFVVELGKKSNNALLRSYLRRAALSVPDVKEVTAVEISAPDPKTRTVRAELRFTTAQGDADVTATARY